MSKNRKSPQEKKALEYEKDHFTFGWDSSRYFPKTWKRKKKNANRQYRRKSQAILAQSKPGTTADDVELLADDLTATRFQKSMSRKRLYKTGTVTLKEKVKQNLEARTLAETEKMTAVADMTSRLTGRSGSLRRSMTRNSKQRCCKPTLFAPSQQKGSGKYCRHTVLSI